ncbi:hypothetical protein C8F04DRAFT_1288904 [Mycena alexandri]|uniref:Uncharacterized protein n=1 Tax=Mycena alexandri TaxID=1745969 RepID=A0AAD6X1T4_9AGAR|nr:hypothetical protein C8F04DRAFT_1288904 [Mycena alexandri]
MGPTHIQNPPAFLFLAAQTETFDNSNVQQTNAGLTPPLLRDGSSKTSGSRPGWTVAPRHSLTNHHHGDLDLSKRRRNARNDPTESQGWQTSPRMGFCCARRGFIGTQMSGSLRAMNEDSFKHTACALSPATTLHHPDVPLQTDGDEHKPAGGSMQGQHLQGNCSLALLVGLYGNPRGGTSTGTPLDVLTYRGPQEEPSVGLDEGPAMQDFTPTRQPGGGSPSLPNLSRSSTTTNLLSLLRAATFVTTLLTPLPRTCLLHTLAARCTAHFNIINTDPESNAMPCAYRGYDPRDFLGCTRLWVFPWAGMFAPVYTSESVYEQATDPTVTVTCQKIGNATGLPLPTTVASLHLGTEIWGFVTTHYNRITMCARLAIFTIIVTYNILCYGKRAPIDNVRNIRTFHRARKADNALEEIPRPFKTKVGLSIDGVAARRLEEFVAGCDSGKRKDWGLKKVEGFEG